MLWQLVQPTPALACGERSKSGCAPRGSSGRWRRSPWPRPWPGLKILVTSPPPSTWALPGAVAVLAGDPVAAVHQRHLGVGIVGESLGLLFVAGGAGLGADVTSDAAARRPWRGAAWLAGGGAAMAVAQSMPAPSINIQHARSPGRNPGAAPIGNRVTGLSSYA